MIYIVLVALAVALLSFFLLRQKNAVYINSLEEYPIEYERKRKVRSDKGKKRGSYKKGVK